MIHGDNALISGLALGTTYVLSVGPSNLMIIREGIVGGRVGLVACSILATYIALLFCSYAATDHLATWNPEIVKLLSWLGLAAILWFAASSIQASWDIKSRQPLPRTGIEPVASCLRRVAVVAVLNPLMYVELLLIPAAIAGTFKDASSRLQFTLGLIFMATACCAGYAIGARLCAALFRHSRALQAFDLISGLLLTVMAWKIGLTLL